MGGHTVKSYKVSPLTHCVGVSWMSLATHWQMGSEECVCEYRADGVRVPARAIHLP